MFKKKLFSSISYALIIVGFIYFCTDLLFNSVAVYENVSTESKYEGIVGSKYRTNEKLLVQGITMDRNYKPIIDHYSILPVPGFSGREVILEDTLDIGAEIEIIGVEECINWVCFFYSDRREYLIRIIDDKKSYLAKLRIYSAYENYISQGSDAAPLLNPRIYTKIN